MFWIGLHLEIAAVKWARIIKKNGLISVDELRTIPSSEDTIVKPLYFQQNHSLKLCTIVSGLSAADVLIRELTVKVREKSKILKLIPFQIESELPFSAEEAVVSLQIFPKKEEKSSIVSLFTVKKTSLSSHIDLWKNLNLEPDEVSCVPTALWRFSSHFFPKITQALHLHIGEKVSSAVCFFDKRILFSHSFSFGFESLVSELEEEALSSSVQRELDRIFSFLLKKMDEQVKSPIENIILTGNLSPFPKLKEQIASFLPSTMKFVDDPQQDPYDATTLKTYAIAIGLAIDSAISDSHSIEFREKAFPSIRKRKKKIKAFISLASAIAAITIASLLGQSLYTRQQTKNLVKAFSFCAQSPIEDSFIDLDILEKKVQKLEITSKKEKNSYPLSPSFPNVSEILAFFSACPEMPTNVEIKSFKYDLVKYPQVGSHKNPYLGKVEMEVEVPNEQSAKNFHSFLQKLEFLVDTKKELSFEKKGATYFVSFFLLPSSGGSL